MKKEEAIKIASLCAKEYRDNLENKNILFVFGSVANPEYFETTFLSRNFLHLTGLQIGKKKSSNEVYDLLLRNKLPLSDVEFSSNGTTEMKLKILSRLMKIDRFGAMVGTYNNSKAYLVTDKLVGNVKACMGFVSDNSYTYYSPNTALNEDIRDIAIKPVKNIFAIFKKDIKEKQYHTLSYISEKISFKDIKFPEELSALINLDIK